MAKAKDRENTNKVVLIVIIVFAIAVFVVALMKKGPATSDQKDRIVRFAAYDNDKMLEEQRAYHNKVENKIDAIQSNMNIQSMTNDALTKKVESIEKQPSKVIIIQDKRKEKKNDQKDADTPHIYGY